ncbi:hypothetical protein RP75_04515 [Agrobacterium arsenijevicii]|uniref:Uncharacterized protein n=2 Tax=Agrobacterium arsenijevicii TaxID=1585697 RepID=A0ABR5DBF3_9HYPH|nr:hypothetical protein RP75_04515 [Agrobacterium arsenijevicii]
MVAMRGADPAAQAAIALRIMTRVKFRVGACCEVKWTALPELVCAAAHDFISKTDASMSGAQLVVSLRSLFFEKCHRFRRQFPLKIPRISQGEVYQFIDDTFAKNEKKFQFITEALTATLQFCLWFDLQNNFLKIRCG